MDLTKAVTTSYIVGAIALIFIIIAIGLVIIRYYKKRDEEQK